jgi:DNA-binding MarR family transcriptional regulator
MKSNLTQDVSLDQSASVYLLIRQTADLTSQDLEYELRTEGCVPEVQSALLFIVKTLENRAAPSEISRLMLRQRHSTCRLIDRMVEKGLLKKTKDLDRKTMKRVSLTDKGEEALQKALLARKTIERIVGALSDKEINCLIGHLQKLRNAAVIEQTVNTKRCFEDLAGYYYR